MSEQRVLIATSTIYLFRDGETGIQYENLSTRQFVQLLLMVADRFTCQQHNDGNRLFPRLRWWAWKRITRMMVK